MAKRKQLKYSFRLFDKRGRRVAAAKLRYAIAYEVFYGQRRLLARKKFPKLLKRVGERRQLLGALVESIESKRLRLIERKKQQRRKAKLEAEKKAAKRRIDRKIKTPLKKGERQKIYRAMDKHFDESEIQIPVFPKAYAAPAATALRATVLDTMIIPVAPDGGDYTKRVVDKEMRRSDIGFYHLSILDFSLNESSYFELNDVNFLEQYKEIVKIFIPHIITYFKDTKKSSFHYILRIKFLNSFKSGAQLTEHGLSYFRTHVLSEEGMLQLFRVTMNQFFGDVAKMGPTSRNKMRRNYLMGENTTIITGFTLEATDIS